MNGIMVVLKPSVAKPEIIGELTGEPPLEDIRAQLNGGYLEAVAGLVTSNGRVIDTLVGPVVVLAGDNEFMLSLQNGEE